MTNENSSRRQRRSCCQRMKSVSLFVIARYFHRKITNIRNELDSIDITQNRCGKLVDDPIYNKNLKPLNAFNEMSESEVYQLIQTSAKKSCTKDPLPTSLVMSSLDELLPSITRIVNCSMTLGHLPTKWKATLVDPRLKKSGQNASLSNLRPVSNLHFISKLTEKAVYNKTQDH